VPPQQPDEGRAWHPSWLMAVATALARTQALVGSFIAAHSVSSVALRWCSLVNWALRDARSPVSSSYHWAGRGSTLICRARSMLVALSDRPTARGLAMYLVVVRWFTAGPLRWLEVSECSPMVVMGTIRVTTLHPLGTGNPELPPSHKAALPLSEDSSRAMCKDGDPMCTIPMTAVPESFPSGERLRRSKRSAVNSKLPKQMVSPVKVHLAMWALEDS
jgi:hypothetical protein